MLCVFHNFLVIFSFLLSTQKLLYGRIKRMPPNRLRRIIELKDRWQKKPGKTTEKTAECVRRECVQKWLNFVLAIC